MRLIRNGIMQVIVVWGVIMEWKILEGTQGSAKTGGEHINQTKERMENN